MSASKRRLLIIGAGIEQIYAYELAREMGLEVIGTDRNPDAPALAHADHVLIADTHDAEASSAVALAFHRERPIHGVMTIAHDVPYTVACVAQALGLPHIPIEAAALAIDKLAMKERFARDGVAIPRFREVKNSDELRQAIAEWGLPVVTKPVDSCGARGVMRVTSDIDPEEAFAVSLEHSKRGIVIVEEYVAGLQLSTEGLAWRGTTTTASWSVRNYERLEEFAPYMIEDGGVLPADLTPSEVQAVCELMDRAARSLGIDNGPVKGDLVMTADGPVVIELAARLSGGYLCTHQIPYARGVNLVRQTILVALGEDIDPADLVPEHRSYLGVRFFFPEPGIVESIEGFDELEDEPWIMKRVMYVAPGDQIDPTTSHPTRAGFVFTVGETAEQAEERARQCAQRVQIRTRPVETALKGI
ncbi:MAG: biotin carboxylase [Planctomycetota bacterium]|jgi:biotin carboxylase